MIRNKATFETRKAKKEFEKKIALDSKEDTKHFWSYARSKTKFKEQVSRVKREDGNLTTSDKETAEEINKAFNTVFVRESQMVATPIPEQVYQGPELTDINFSVDQVLKHLKKLKPNKACGPDGVSPMVLNRCAESLSPPL